MEMAQGPRGCLGVEEGGGRGGARGEGVGRGRLGGGRGLGFVPPPSWALAGPLMGLSAVARGPGCLTIVKTPLVGYLIN